MAYRRRKQACARWRFRPVDAGGVGAKGSGGGPQTVEEIAWRLDIRAEYSVAQPQAGAQEFLRVDRFAFDACFVVQMRAGGAAGRADLADGLPDAHLLADLDVDLRYALLETSMLHRGDRREVPKAAVSPP